MSVLTNEMLKAKLFDVDEDWLIVHWNNFHLNITTNLLERKIIQVLIVDASLSSTMTKVKSVKMQISKKLYWHCKRIRAWESSTLWNIRSALVCLAINNLQNSWIHRQVMPDPIWARKSTVIKPTKMSKSRVWLRVCQLDNSLMKLESKRGPGKIMLEPQIRIQS